MNYKLYISDHCLSCSSVLDYVSQLNIRFTAVNLSEPNANRPDHLMIVPALFANEELVAYGSDIRDYLLGKSE